jgi:phosphatidylglycerophosphate synthase
MTQPQDTIDGRPVVRLRGLPDLISASRLAATAVLGLGGVLQNRGLVVGAIAYALLSDVIDGPLARALGQAGERGAQLDTIADAALLCVSPVAIYASMPFARDRLGILIILVYASYMVPITAGLLKYRRLTSYHTWAARCAVVLLAVGFAAFLIWHVVWPLAIGVAVLIGSGIEEFVITLLLPTWHADVRSLSAALKLVRGATTGT